MQTKMIIITRSIGLVLLFAFTSCTNCSRSARISNKEQIQDDASNNAQSNRNNRSHSSDEENIVPLTKANGVYYISIIINGVPMEAIFDTGASTISMSQTEVNFLYKQGKLSDSDFTGTQNFVNANGDVSEESLINLKNVKIGNKTVHNVTASVVPNFGAPILLGQTALSKLGKITVDYKKNLLTFE